MVQNYNILSGHKNETFENELKEINDIIDYIIIKKSWSSNKCEILIGGGFNAYIDIYNHRKL